MPHAFAASEKRLSSLPRNEPRLPRRLKPKHANGARAWSKQAASHTYAATHRLLAPIW